MKDLPVILQLALAALIAPVQAGIASTAPRQESVIASQCQNLRIRGTSWWMVGNCLTGADSTTRIESSIYLNGKIDNIDGVLKWVEGDRQGGGFLRTCSECSFHGDDATIRCVRCYKSEGGFNQATLYLDEHISVYNGHLLSDLKGKPTPPTASSPYPVPQSFAYSLNGNFSCPGSKYNAQECRDLGNCRDGQRDDISNNPFSFSSPQDCWVPQVYWEDFFTWFRAVRLQGEGMWEAEAFADTDCQESVGTVSAEEMGICKPMGDKLVKALRIKPAFNGGN